MTPVQNVGRPADFVSVHVSPACQGPYFHFCSSARSNRIAPVVHDTKRVVNKRQLIAKSPREIYNKIDELILERA